MFMNPNAEKKRLVPNAKPTLFAVPNPPPKASSTRRQLKRLSSDDVPGDPKKKRESAVVKEVLETVSDNAGLDNTTPVEANPPLLRPSTPEFPHDDAIRVSQTGDQEEMVRAKPCATESRKIENRPKDDFLRQPYV